MKKIILVFSFVLLAVMMLNTKEIKAEETVSSVDYTADFSEGIPSDWTLYSKSGTTAASSSKTENGVSITGGNIAQEKYYGTLYEINCGSDSIGDFELSFTFRWISYANTARWIGILYHTQKTNDMLSAYMMNYRVQGKSAQSSISSTPTFNDNGVVENTGIPMTDLAFHTLSISCSDGHVIHYMDNTKIMEYDTETYANYLGKDQTAGGFALIVNNSTIEVKSLTIKGTVGSQSSSELDTSVVDTYTPKISCYTEFSLNTFINSEDDLKALTGTEKPANAILYINKDMEVVNSEGDSLNISLKDAYDTYIKGSIIPVVYIRDEETATNLIKYLKKTLNIVDIAVASNNPDLVLQVRKGRTSIRGILDWSENTYTEESWDKIVQDTNKAYANIALLNKETATAEAIYYIQARFKTVWVNNTEYSGLDIVNEVTSGAYGVVTSDISQAITDLKTLKNSALSSRNFTRMPYNIAHRGTCLTNYENSLEAFIEAYENGATHLELDIQMSKDNKLVVMHDDTIDRTTNGTGSVSSYTAEQLKNYQITKTYSGTSLGGSVAIPMYDEVLEYFKGKDIVIITEIKTSNAQAVSVLKEYLDKYDMYGQVVVISFYDSQLEKMRDILPEIPTGNLNGIDSSEIGSSTLSRLGAINCGMDYSYGYINGAAGRKYVTELAMRGFSTWTWTYQSESDILGAVNSRVLGITNNSADTISEMIKGISYSGSYVIDSTNTFTGASISVDAVKYNREVIKDAYTATPFYIEDHGNYAYAVFSTLVTYTNKETSSVYKFTLFTDVIKIVKEGAYVSASDMNALASKSYSELTESDKEMLEMIPEAYTLLDEDEKAAVDYEKLNSLIEALNAEKAAEEAETSTATEETTAVKEVTTTASDAADETSKKGCGSAISVSLAGLFALMGTAFISLKRKSDKE